jgi:hypothetical protein
MTTTDTRTTDTATVQTLTAEVRTLVVGNRQVTLSVYRQLDHVDPEHVEPFGRVQDQSDYWGGQRRYVCVVGRDRRDGTLVSARRRRASAPCGDVFYEPGTSSPAAEAKAMAEWEAWNTWLELPLIVLAGLR